MASRRRADRAHAYPSSEVAQRRARRMEATEAEIEKTWTDVRRETAPSDKEMEPPATGPKPAKKKGPPPE